MSHTGWRVMSRFALAASAGAPSNSVGQSEGKSKESQVLLPQGVRPGTAGRGRDGSGPWQKDGCAGRRGGCGPWRDGQAVRRDGPCVWLGAASLGPCLGTTFGDHGDTAAAQQLCLLGNGSHTALRSGSIWSGCMSSRISRRPWKPPGVRHGTQLAEVAKREGAGAGGCCCYFWCHPPKLFKPGKVAMGCQSWSAHQPSPRTCKQTWGAGVSNSPMGVPGIPLPPLLPWTLLAIPFT